MRPDEMLGVMCATDMRAPRLGSGVPAGEDGVAYGWRGARRCRGMCTTLACAGAGVGELGGALGPTRAALQV